MTHGRAGGPARTRRAGDTVDPTPPPEEPTETAAPADDEDVDEVLVVTAPKPITAASALTASARDVELRPLTRPGDVAEVILFLLSDKAAMLNGLALPIEGGFLVN